MLTEIIMCSELLKIKQAYQELQSSYSENTPKIEKNKEHQCISLIISKSHHIRFTRKENPSGDRRETSVAKYNPTGV